MKRTITILLLMSVQALCATSHNVFDKAYYHQGSTQQAVENHASKNPLHVELGSLVFYFKGDRLMNPLPSREDTKEHVTCAFFFPKADVKGAILNTVNSIVSQGYQLKMESVKAPIAGVKLYVTYNPQEISFQYENFESIKLQKGVVFRFFNKKLINLIGQREAVVARIAHNTRIPRVVIDCGHGGADSGAVGLKYAEKDVCLAVGKYLASYLQQKGCQVVLTRARDEQISLEDRTACANKYHDAQALVSLHANSSSDKQTSGIETFHLDKSLFVSGDKKIGSVGSQVGAAIVHARYQNGQALAQCVHHSVIDRAKHLHVQVVDRKVKKAASQVLMGSTMPATLVELGFVSNPKEEQLLGSQAYQAALAHGIGTGIMKYINGVKKF